MRTVVVKVDNRKAHQMSDLTLMNARKKEKKKKLQEARKPQTNAEWVALSDDMKKQYELNITWRSKTDYARHFGYPPYKFVTEWRREHKYFDESIEAITYICASRRDEYMDSKDKLYLQYLKQLPQYDLEYMDYERAMKLKDQHQMGDIHVHIDEVPKTDKVPEKK